MEKLPPERSETGGETGAPATKTNQDSIGPFRSLAKRLLNVSPVEVRKKEQEWRERRETER